MKDVVRRRSLIHLLTLTALVAALAMPALSQVVLASHTPNPTSVTIAGSLQSEVGCPGDWQPDCATTHLTYDANDDVWQGTWTVPAGNWEYKAALNNSWDENYGLHAAPGGSIAVSDLIYAGNLLHWLA